jgi:tetratricopeptide (TPR) repeat protein
MNTDREKLIIGMIKNKLNTVQTVHFDDLFANDENFREDFIITSHLMSNINDKKTMDIRAKLDSIYNEMYVTHKKTKMIRLIKQNWYSAAVVIAVLVMIGTFWFSYLNKQGWNEQLYNTYYEADEVFVNTRSKANFNVDVLHHGMELLEKKDFSAALAEFNKLPNSLTANYYSGVANMELNNHELAVIKFDYVIEDYLNLFYDQAQWYKGLCLVKLEKKTEAISLFYQIAQTESYFKDKAKQIVADLREN